MADDGNVINNYHIGGGRGGAGGEGRNGAGGVGGQGMGIDILHRAATLEAVHDSADSFMEPKCHPKTRTQMLKDLRKWALDPCPKTSILWLYGPAGAGKTAIMRTLATQLHDDTRLGGCFFFKRSHVTRSNARTLFTTIAYQLALNVESLRTPISEVVEKNPLIVGLSIRTQMQQLISEPCRAHEDRQSLVIVIDGLDECDGHAFQGEILRAILDPSSNHPICFRFIIASRPEAHIREMFDSPVHSGRYHSVNVKQSFDDVRKYLCDEFSRIHREHYTMAKIPLPWPTPDILQKLVENSSGHFIYASTIIKFIDDKSYRPTERLEMVQDPNSSGSESAFDTLDQLYRTILCSATRQSQLIPILCAIVYFELGVSEIDQFFGFTEGETRLLLRGLHSVLQLWSDDRREIHSHHASFVDFLKNPDRSGNFCVGTLNRRIGLAQSLLQFYASLFQRNEIRCLSRLIDFIVSLPPSNAVAELFPLIASVNPHYIFRPAYLSNVDLASITSWLKNNPSAPTDVIQLWEDYAFMFSIEWPTEGVSVQYIVSPSPELLRILVSLGFLRLYELPTTLDLTWTDLRATLCRLGPSFVGDEHTLPVHQQQTTSPWAARDVALQLIRKMVKNHNDTNGGANPSASRDAVWMYNAYSYIHNLKEAYTQFQHGLGINISSLVRLSPPCPVLYRELWSIPPSEIWSTWVSDKLIHHVSKWLKTFPDSTTDLITFWQQAAPDPKLCHISPYNPGWITESDWRDGVRSYNDMIVRLHLPNSLKIIT
ncbi:putative nwd2 protein [Mycena sanguinolenta]|uniref:Putative nwd2 protein n=1 Tax=Mycena sanguinolenta TaxID=230812 RepID=A0A8H6Z8T8_9AGAR|nr:putative nwd2 protein [Mycena sanguinolenta]